MGAHQREEEQQGHKHASHAVVRVLLWLLGEHEVPCGVWVARCEHGEQVRVGGALERLVRVRRAGAAGSRGQWQNMG